MENREIEIEGNRENLTKQGEYQRFKEHSDKIVAHTHDLLDKLTDVLGPFLSPERTGPEDGGKNGELKQRGSDFEDFSRAHTNRLGGISDRINLIINRLVI